MRTLWLARMVAFPVVGGLLVFWFHDAPAHYAAVNAGAFLAGLLVIHFGRLPQSDFGRRLLGGSLLVLLALPLLTGPSIDGVSR